MARSASFCLFHPAASVLRGLGTRGILLVSLEKYSRGGGMSPEYPNHGWTMISGSSCGAVEGGAFAYRLGPWVGSFVAEENEVTQRRVVPEHHILLG